MKIAFLSCSSGVVYRGVETFVHELANGLSQNHEVFVYQSGPKLSDSHYQTKIISLNIHWTKENGLRSLSKPLYRDFNPGNLLRRFYLDYWQRKQGEFTLLALKRIDQDTDVIVTAGSGWVSLFARLWAWRHRVKLVIVGQSGPGWDDRVSLWCRPDIFIAVSQHAAAWAKSAGFGVPIKIIPNGVDIEKFNPQLKPAKVALPRPLFVCVAALEPGKRIDLVIKAISQLKKGSLLVMGDGHLKENLEKLGHDLLPGRFQISYVKYPDVPAYYAAADVVTMAPYGFESFGLVFLEAMACNKPVVAPDDPIRHEIIGDAGIFVDPQNSDNYADGLQKALQKNWSDLPRQQAEKFSWDKITEQYEKLFKSL